MPITFAWNATGHQLVAEIAYLQLDENKRKAVDRILNHDFVKASIWADTVRAQGNDSMNSWHYINLPNIGPQKNVVDAIRECEKNLQQPNHLKGLIHWVGDVHQPLHTIGRDRGGNSFYLAANPYGRNLHQFWDNGAGALREVKNLKQTAMSWLKLYPPSAEQLNEQDPMQWAWESYALAVNHAYVGIAPKSLPSEKYTEQTQEITKQQIVLAGMRLANIINQSSLK
ncbi:MAG: S1/P1 nuclease [Gammaproteobacteria bacterium]